MSILVRRSWQVTIFSSGVLSGARRMPVCLTVRRRSLPPCILPPFNSVLPGILPGRQRHAPPHLGRQSWRVSTNRPLWSRRGNEGGGDFTKGDRLWLDESLREPRAKAEGGKRLLAPTAGPPWPPQARRRWRSIPTWACAISIL